MGSELQTHTKKDDEMTAEICSHFPNAYPYYFMFAVHVCNMQTQT